MDAALPDEATLFSVLNGVETSKRLALAGFMLNIWDIAITLDEEVAFFWSGDWTVSRVLFLFVSEVVWLKMFWDGSMKITEPLLTPGCSVSNVATWEEISLLSTTIKTVLMLSVVCLVIVQAVLVTRIWHLFPHSKTIRIVTVASSILAVIISTVFMVQTFPLIIVPDQKISPNQYGCSIPPPHTFWRFFLPALILHTLLFVFTCLRAFRTPKVFRDAPLMRRLLRDGGIFYLVIVVIVGLSAIGAFFVDFPAISLPATYSNLITTVSSVAISRLMLNIRSLAERLGYDERWIFSNVEIGRLNWKKGAREGEITVDVEDHETEQEDDVTLGGTPRVRNSDLVELGIMDGCSSYRGSKRSVQVTRVGELPSVGGGMPPVADW
ncbi:hypothetical protein PQX77_004844 [Marasmius sp. AFHP31]|nr:hypothetical protein PQX77_004844 [Marasmius sp. AFHP31]